MDLVQRVKDILLKPAETWPVIEGEAATPASLYVPYLVLLAAVPALAGFVSTSIIGINFGMGSYRVPIVSGLISAVVGYGLSLAMVYVLSLIVDALAPTFGGTKNPVQALKVVVYSMTAGMVGGIFNVVPYLGWLLALAASIYSLYLLYLGLPVLMKAPKEKAVAYTVVVVICAIVAGVVMSLIVGLVTPKPSMGDFGGLSLKSGDGEVRIDGDKMAEFARKMEEASKKMEAASASGDPAAATKAMADALGGAQGPLIAAQDLKARLPDTLSGLPRTSIEAESGQAMGVGSSVARAQYSSGERGIDVSITDTGGLGGLMSVATWANVTVDRERDGAVEKVYKQGARTVREEYRKDGSQAEYMLVLGNGVLVEARGHGVDIAAVKAAVAAVNPDALEGIKR